MKRIKNNTTPILLLWFNRPAHALAIIQRLRQVAPTRLYISCDGARAHKPGEAEKVAEVHALLAQIDWNCEVKTHFLPQNLGCRRGVQSGINWFFDEVEEGIILEDDCLPHPYFLSFAEQMLQKYRTNSQIMHIAGGNFLPGIASPDDYFYSAIPYIWGWATWRRAWQLYQSEYEGLDEAFTAGVMQHFSSFSPATAYLREKFLDTRAGKYDTWDYAWFYTILLHKGLCITPNGNLVQNTGYGEGATNTTSGKPLCAEISLQNLAPHSIHHPTRIAKNTWRDLRLFMRSHKSLPRMMFRYLFPFGR